MIEPKENHAARRTKQLQLLERMVHDLIRVADDVDNPFLLYLCRMTEHEIMSMIERSQDVEWKKTLPE